MLKRPRHTTLLLRIFALIGASGLAVYQVAESHSESGALRPWAPVFRHMPIPLTIPTTPPRQTLILPLASDSPPIRVRLWAAARLQRVTVTAPEGLFVNGSRFPVSIEVVSHKGKLIVRAEKRDLLTTTALTVKAVRGGTFDLKEGKRRQLVTAGEARFRLEKDAIEIVNRIDLESYLLGIAEPELGSLNLPAEALKAQIIAARSYTLAVTGRHPHEPYEFCDGPHCQVYAGLGHLPRKFQQTAAAVRGLYLRYKGKPAVGFFHHSCGGSTAAIEDVWKAPRIPYLRRVQDPQNERLGPQGTEWSFRMDRKAFARFLAREGWLKKHQALNAIGVIRTDASGRARQILVQTSEPKWIPADAFRRRLNQRMGDEVLKSTLFKIVTTADEIRFEGRGWGHGVGLCQCGTVTWARKGKTARQILAHYFPGTDLGRLPRKPQEVPKADPKLVQYLHSLVD
jgi:stage II sporulation protein D